MPEEEAFCVLVRLVNDFNIRDFYTPKMVGLQVKNYQLENLIRIECPQVYHHLQIKDVTVSMYASQWFMTMFAYRFPLDIVYRILDTVFAEGSVAILRFSLALVFKF